MLDCEKSGVLTVTRIYGGPEVHITPTNHPMWKYNNEKNNFRNQNEYPGNQKQFLKMKQDKYETISRKQNETQ